MKVTLIVSLLAASLLAGALPVSAKGGKVQQSPCMSETGTKQCPVR